MDAWVNFSRFERWGLGTGIGIEIRTGIRGRNFFGEGVQWFGVRFSVQGMRWDGGVWGWGLVLLLLCLWLEK